MELDTEKFNSLNELMAVQKQIAAIRAELLAEKSTLEQFKLEKEKEALLIVDGVLTASKDALVEADKNRDAIASLLAVATDCLNDVKASHKELQDLVDFYTNNFDQTVALLNDKSHNLKVANEELKRQREQLKDDEANLRIRVAALNKEKVFVADRKKMLVAELDRIKHNIK
jgi:hypothetical protein